jgi:protein-S-isoprenylcysteine O-methyltransferase Ste14
MSMPEHVSTHDMAAETRRKIVRWCVQSAAGLVGYGAILFLAAGTAGWVWGWVLLGVLAAVIASHVLVLVPINPEVLAEREEGLHAEGTKGWDRWLTSVAVAFGTVVLWVIAGLEMRFRWTGGMPIVLHIAGLVVTVIGYAIFLWAMAANAFFAEGVRIQEERGHTVATGGPYQYVRHPGYVGAILAIVGGPLLLGSWWAWIPAVLSVAGYVIRTSLEDRTLQAELPGYREYAQRTRHRLIPGVW